MSGALNPPMIVAVVDVARRRADQHQRAEQLRRLRGEDADHRADRMADETPSHAELAADLDHVVGVALQRRHTGRGRRPRGRSRRSRPGRTGRRGVVLEGRRDQPPHVLVAAEAVREDDRTATGHTADPHRVRARGCFPRVDFMGTPVPPVAGQPVGCARKQPGTTRRERGPAGKPRPYPQSPVATPPVSPTLPASAPAGPAGAPARPPNEVRHDRNRGPPHSPDPLPRPAGDDVGTSGTAPSLRDGSTCRAVAYQRVVHRLVRRELRLLAELATWAPDDEAERTATLTRHSELVGKVLLHHHTVERDAVVAGAAPHRAGRRPSTRSGAGSASGPSGAAGSTTCCATSPRLPASGPSPPLPRRGVLRLRLPRARRRRRGPDRRRGAPPPAAARGASRARDWAAIAQSAHAGSRPASSCWSSAWRSRTPPPPSARGCSAACPPRPAPPGGSTAGGSTAPPSSGCGVRRRPADPSVAEVPQPAQRLRRPADGRGSCRRPRWPAPASAVPSCWCSWLAPPSSVRPGRR